MATLSLLNAAHDVAPRPRRRRRLATSTAALLAVSTLALGACTISSGQDYKITYGYPDRFYATIFAHESWEISYDVWIYQCKGSPACVANFIDPIVPPGWGAAQFHEANADHANLGIAMYSILERAGWLGLTPTVCNSEGCNWQLPPPGEFPLGMSGYIGGGYCMRIYWAPAEGDGPHYTNEVGPWHSGNDCQAGRVLYP